MELSKFEEGQKIVTQVKELSAHKEEIKKGVSDQSNATVFIALLVPYHSVKIHFREEFMLVTLDKSVELYIGAIDKKIAQLEKQFENL